MYSVLFVCTGNICRSPSGEGVLRDRIEKEGLSGQVNVDSAGTHGYHIGERPDHRAIVTAGKRGVSLDSLRARKVNKDDFEAFDLILAMDRGHYDILFSMAPPDKKERIRLFTDFCNEYTHLDAVPDPYYGGVQDFEYMLDIIDDAMPVLLQQIKESL